MIELLSDFGPELVSQMPALAVLVLVYYRLEIRLEALTAGLVAAAVEESATHAAITTHLEALTARAIAADTSP